MLSKFLSTIKASFFLRLHTVGRVLNAWFNDCVVGKTGESTNPIIAKVDPVPYSSTCTFMFANLLTANVGKTLNSQLKPVLRYIAFLYCKYTTSHTIRGTLLLENEACLNKLQFISRH